MCTARLLFLSVFLASTASIPALQISEILTENEGGLQDADSSSPSWLEIYNETAGAVNLSGWSLTDDKLLPAKWLFPSRSLAAGARLVVFASGKNRAPVAGELHANFQLDPDGEYLALVAPDGSKATQFDPFPKLRRNVSWTYAASAPLVTPVVASTGSLRWLVPTDGSLGNSWQLAAFNESAWNTGPVGLGFDTSLPAARIDIKTVTSVNSLPAPAGWVGYSFAGVAETGTTGPATITTTVGGISVKLDPIGGTVLSSRNRQGTTTDSLLDTQSLNNLVEDFVFSLNSNYVAGTPKGMDVTVGGLTPNTVYPVTLYAYDRASPALRSAAWTDPVSGSTGLLNFQGSDGQLATNETFLTRSLTLLATSNASGQIVLQGRAASAGGAQPHNVFLNAIQVGQPSYSSFIATNVATALQNTAASLYARTTVSVPNPSYYQSLRLRVRYDDGFNAYLNGQLVASRNAPAVSAWNSAATADQPKASGLTQEEITIPLTSGMLVTGTNVLAFQGLKQGAADTDFLLQPVVDLLGTLPAGGLYFPAPTPGAVNSTGYPGMVRDTVFTVDRQYFTGTVTTAISCPTPGAEIRYTLDGSVPTATSGSVYTSPLTFSNTAILRAAGFYPLWLSSNPDTQSFLKGADFAAQPANPAGWAAGPAAWGTNLQGTTTYNTPSNYAMDQRVVSTTVAGYGIPEALASLPTISVAMAPADLLGSNGIYQNPKSTGAAWERDCSAELIDPTLAEPGFHERCRIEVHGNSSRNPFRMQKHSLRLSFKADNGSSKLRYKFFPGSKVEGANKIILRATFTDGWGLVSWNSTRYRPDDSVMMRDVWVRKSWAAMGNVSPNSRYVHLVLNGLYWGVYDAAEHIDDDFVALHEGGLPTDWEVVADFVDPDTSATSNWKNMYAAAALDQSVPANYSALLQYLDPVNFADYYLLHQYAECEDWPHHNGAAYRNKAVGSKYKWLAWDQEISLQETGATNGHNIDRISPNAPNTITARTPGALWNALRNNKDWRLLVADRAHVLLNNNGPLAATLSAARWQAIASTLDRGIVAESARWGDTAVETPYGGDDLGTDGGLKRSRPGVLLKDPYLRTDWLNAVNYVANTWIPSLSERANSFALISRLATNSFWPTTEPVVFSKHGGIVSTGSSIQFTSGNNGATIYYTTDGRDPRESVTGNAVGTAGNSATLNQTSALKVRAVLGVPGSGTEVWSALTSANFIVGTAASVANLAITEMAYNPPGNEGWEFLELMNISNGPIDLTDVKFTVGISFNFAVGTILQAGQRLVLVDDAVAFAAKFPAVAIHGVYTGKLDNGGESLRLVDATGADIRNFEYDDASPWPAEADGTAFTLTLIAPETNPNHALAQNWRSSRLANGSPGTGDKLAFTGNPSNSVDTNGDGFSDLLNYALVSPQGEIVGLAAGEFRLRLAADDARVTIETSPDLQTWTPVSPGNLTFTREADEMVVQAIGDDTAVHHFLRARVEPR